MEEVSKSVTVHVTLVGTDMFVEYFVGDERPKDLSRSILGTESGQRNEMESVVVVRAWIT